MGCQYGMLIDLNRCTGCYACVVACKQEHDLPPSFDLYPGSTGFSFIHIEKIGPDGEYPHLTMFFRPRLCMHCAQPPCVDVCSTGALKKERDGRVLINSDHCIMCGACTEVCPYEAISIDVKNETARKCDFCMHLKPTAEQPACVAACNAGAMIFGNIDDKESPIARAISAHEGDCYALHSEEDTRPSVFYRKK